MKQSILNQIKLCQETNDLSFKRVWVMRQENSAQNTRCSTKIQLKKTKDSKLQNHLNPTGVGQEAWRKPVM